MTSLSHAPSREAVHRGLLDTSVLVDLGHIDPAFLPEESMVSTISLAELAAGPHATNDPKERAIRQATLQGIETTLEALPFDGAAAQAFGRLYAAVAPLGRKPRGRRTVDLFIAATALANSVPLYTRNPVDFAGLEGVVEIIAV